jgi:hypothetical protein
MNKGVQKKVFTLPREEYYLKYLTILNRLFQIPLKGKSIEVLACFLSLDKKITQDDMFNTLARQKVREKLGISYSNLSVQISSLINYGIIVKNPITERLSVNDKFLPGEPEHTFQIKLILDENNF